MSKYKKFKENDDRFELLIVKSLWKRNFVGEINDDMKIMLNNILSAIDCLNCSLIRYFAILCSYAATEEYITCYDSMTLEQQKFDRSLNAFINRYGNIYGNIKYNEDRRRIESNKTKIRLNNPEWKEHWIAKGYTETESIKKSSTYRKNNGKKNYKKEKQFYPKRSDISLCEEYWIARGYSSNDAKVEVAKAKEKCVNSKDAFVKRYGDDIWESKWNVYITKRKITWKNKIKNPEYVINYGKASKESLGVFIPVNDFVCKEFEKETVYLGHNDCQEWRIYNRFYDFTLRDNKLIIEYNGENYHPRNATDNNPRLYTGKLSVEEKYNYDREKIALAEAQGFKVLEIWSSDSVEYNINKCKEWIYDNTKR